MRKIVFTMTVSLDGYFEGPQHEIDWHQVDDGLLRHFNEWIGAAGALLDGRITHELMASYWPTADAGPTVSEPVAEFARIWRDMPKMLFSRTVEHADWNTTIVRDVVPEQILALKAQPGGDLIIGGANLAQAFLRHDLIDEYRFYVQPIILGRGRPLFQPMDTSMGLRLAETQTFGHGVVLLRYERVRPGEPGPEAGQEE
jgi:dihydrofolate reductase